MIECRRRGWLVGNVEKWNQHAFVRQDLFGILDLIACTPEGVLGIQACGGSDHAEHRQKLLAVESTAVWLATPGALLEIWSWSKRVAYRKDRTKAVRPAWTLRVERLLAKDLPGGSMRQVDQTAIHSV